MPNIIDQMDSSRFKSGLKPSHLTNEEEILENIKKDKGGTDVTSFKNESNHKS